MSEPRHAFRVYVPPLGDRSRGSDARARHRRHHGDFQRRQRRAHQPAALSRFRRARPDRPLDRRHRSAVLLRRDLSRPMRTTRRRLQDLGVWSPGDTATVTGQGDPEEVRTLTASRGVLTTLGVRPEIGRWFSTADDTPGAPDTVMLTTATGSGRSAETAPCCERALTINGASPPDRRRDAGGLPLRRRARLIAAAADRPRRADPGLPARSAWPG